jgi:beta-lactam-binding protein with PASTA domain
MPTMPNIVGQPWQEATASLISAGITPGNGTVAGAVPLGYFQQWPVNITWIPRGTKVAGTVTAQSPASGTTGVAFGATVTLTVANYPVSVSAEFSGGGYS